TARSLSATTAARSAAADAAPAARATGAAPAARLQPGVVEDLADAAGARDDVLDVVQAALFVPVRAWLGLEDARRREAPIEPERVDDGVRMRLRDAANVLGRDDEVHGDALGRPTLERGLVIGERADHG